MEAINHREVQSSAIAPSVLWSYTDDALSTFLTLRCARASSETDRLEILRVRGGLRRCLS